MGVRLSGSLGSGDVNVGILLGKTGTVSLKDASSVIGGGTTIYGRTNASSGYNRINYYSSASAADGSTPHGLAEFTGYVHNNTPSGTVDSVSKGINTVSFNWTNPTGFNADSGSGNNIYWDSTGYTSEANATNNGVPTTLLTNSTSNTFTKNTGLTADRWYVFDIQSTWNDSSQTFVDGDRAGAAGGYSVAGGIPISIGGTGGGFIIGPVCSSAPVINSAVQTTDPDSCFVGTDVNIRINITLCEGAGTAQLRRATSTGTSWPSGWTVIDSSISDGFSGNVNDPNATSGNNYYYRLYYNSVGSGTYVQSGPISATCNLV